MRVCGDNFAVASERGLYISVWNWKSGEHISDFVCSLFQIKWNPIHLTKSQTASLQASVFTFLDEYHILFPSSIDDGLYVYDIRAMPPINTRKQKMKGTHCFEITVPQLWGNGTVCNITLESNSLTTGSDAATGLFYTSPHHRMISLRFTVGLNPRDMRASWGKDYREMHVHAHPLLMWTQAHPAPPNACVTIPWSVWSASAARVVAPRKNDDDVVYMYPSYSRFSGCGMRIISAASVQSDGTAGVSIADYHPARVFRGFKKEVVRHTHASQTEVEAGFRSKCGVVYAGRIYLGVNNGTYSGLRSECPPLSRVSALFSPFSFPTFYFCQRSPSARPALILYLRWR
jgi:hypothetical protein